MKSVTTAALLLSLIGIAPTQAPAADGKEPLFGLPAACTPGKDCFILNYFDHDPGPGARDYRCGAMTYDLHDGTDLALPDLAAMARGVPVLAAAAGRVNFARDGIDDISFRDRSEDAIKGRACGNAVYLEHDGRWLTQYCHMRKGSIKVKVGDRVEEGQPLGLVGESGLTEFPHIHIGVKYDAPDPKNAKYVDPFVGLAGISNCGASAKSMWKPEVASVLTYQRGIPYIAGITEVEPTDVAARNGTLTPHDIPAGSKTLYLWADIVGVEAGDSITFRLFGPDGRTIFQTTQFQPSTKQRIFRSAKAEVTSGGGGWDKGTYKGEVFITPRGGGIAIHNLARREAAVK